MSATDELCEMLADRCEEFFVNDFGVNWRYYSDPHTATEGMDGTLIVTGLTPEQAIAATLGTGTCHKVRVHMQIEDEMHCSECGRFLGFAGDAGAPPCNYCPNCGAKVVAE